MKKASLVFMMVILIGSVSSTIPAAFANPSFTVNLSPSPNINPGDIVTAGVTDVTSATETEGILHSHAKLLVENPASTPTNAAVCAVQVNNVGNSGLWRLVADPQGLDPAIPGNADQNAGGSTDIHETFAAQGPSTTHFVQLQVGTGAPFVPVVSAGATLYIHTGTGFVAWPYHVAWAKAGNLAIKDTTNLPGQSLFVEDCAFHDTNNNQNQDTGEANIVAASEILISTPKFVGGMILPIDMTSLLVAGIFTNAVWMVPTLGGIAGAAVTLYKIKRKHD